MPKLTNNPRVSALSSACMLSVPGEKQRVGDILLAVGCLLMATVLKGWTEHWPAEGWLSVALLVAVVLAIVGLDWWTLPGAKE